MQPKADSKLRGSNLAFVLIVLASYLATGAFFYYMPRGVSGIRLLLFVSAAAAYFLLGTLGFARVSKSGSPKLAILYALVQVLLATAMFYLSFAVVLILVTFPLMTQCANLLPLRWLVGLCGLLLVVAAITLGYRGGIGAIAVIGSFYLACAIFVLASHYVAVKERKARTETEKLASELREANLKLTEYSVKIEELATAKERNRLAREIHDTLGHYLTVINIQIEAARAVMDADPAQARESLRKAQALAQDGLADVRQSVAALRSNPALDRPLGEVLNSLVNETIAAGIPTHLTVQGTPRVLHPQVNVTVYRALQEGLTNVRKHSQARSAAVLLDYSRQDTVTLVLKDDGVGSSDCAGGFGLLGIRERAQLLGGNLTTQSAPGQGFVLAVSVPV